MHYFCRNQGPNSIQVITSTLHAALGNRLESLGLPRWKQDINNEIDQFSDTDDLTVREQRVATIHFKLAGYERMEAVSLLEQALWKRKNDECKAEQTDILGRYTRKKAKIDRQNSRINCGAAIVISNVLPFLGSIEPPSAVVPIE